MDVQTKRLKVRFNRQRAEQAILRKKANITASTLGAMALAIYGYSMYTIKQEAIIKQIDDEIEKM